MGIFNFFKKKNDLENEAKRTITLAYRNKVIGSEMAPTQKTSDEEIFNIFKEVRESFNEVSKKRNEKPIPAQYMFGIVFKFLQVYEKFDQKFYSEHLNYELNKYQEEGLREDYKKEFHLF